MAVVKPGKGSERMKMKLTVLFCDAFLAIVGLAAPTISDLMVTPIAPWGLSIDYQVEGVTEDNSINYVLAVKATTDDGAVTNVAQTLVGDVGCKNGAHRVYWNMAKDGISIEREQTVIEVGYKKWPLYCIVDLSGGSNATSYAVTYQDKEPSGDFTNEVYKTTKLVLKRVNAGTFIMGKDQTNEAHRVTITKPFYMGLFEVTQKQWELVTGTNVCSSTSYGKGDSYPIHYVSYDMIRGGSEGSRWPVANSVDSTSFVGKLRAKTDIMFDLPTEAQWEYTCRAGTTTTFSYGDSENGDYMWYGSNSSCSTHEVGTKLPNDWGFYDMHGNVWEWCLDWYGDRTYGADPYGPSSGTNRMLRGGFFNVWWAWVTSTCQINVLPSKVYADNSSIYVNDDHFGLRLCWPLTSEIVSTADSDDEALTKSSVSASVANVACRVMADGRAIDGAITVGYAPHGTTNAVVLINDEKFVEASAAGSQIWTPAKGGDYTLKHTVGGIALEATYTVLPHFVVKDLKVTSIPPWGVAIDYAIEEAAEDSADCALQITAITQDGSVTNVAKTLSGDVACSNGAHRVYWNTAKDGITIMRERAVIEVGYKKWPLYCIVDLLGGVNVTAYAVTYMDKDPCGGFTNEVYKTTKMVLKRVDPGAFIMGEDQTNEAHRVTLTKPFYMGLFEVTQKQWELVTGTNVCSSTSYGKGDAYPVHYVSYDAIRGSSSGAKWPASNAVDASSFLGVLRKKTGLDFDLPTEAQWEYTCRAGTTTTYSFGDSEDGDYVWNCLNSSMKAHEVGTKLPNKWGLYDMHGNENEWCLDWFGMLAYGTDPKGSSSGSRRVKRGGCWGLWTEASSYRNGDRPSDGDECYGFRLSWTLP